MSYTTLIMYTDTTGRIFVYKREGKKHQKKWCCCIAGWIRNHSTQTCFHLYKRNAIAVNYHLIYSCSYLGGCRWAWALSGMLWSGCYKWSMIQKLCRVLAELILLPRTPYYFGYDLMQTEIWGCVGGHASAIPSSVLSAWQLRADSKSVALLSGLWFESKLLSDALWWRAKCNDSQTNNMRMFFSCTEYSQIPLLLPQTVRLLTPLKLVAGPIVSLDTISVLIKSCLIWSFIILFSWSTISQSVTESSSYYGTERK